MELFAGPLFVHYSQFYVLDGPELPTLEACFAGQVNGLCGAASRGSRWLTTDTHTGRVRVEVGLVAAEPPVPADGDVVDVSWTCSSGPSLVQWGGEGFPPLAVPAGSYRVRDQVLDLDAGSDGTGLDVAEQERRWDHPVEILALSLWPAAPKPDRVVRVRSGTAASWHSTVGGAERGRL